MKIKTNWTKIAQSWEIIFLLNQLADDSALYDKSLFYPTCHADFPCLQDKKEHEFQFLCSFCLHNKERFATDGLQITCCWVLSKHVYLPNEPTSQALQYFVNKIHAENTVFAKTLKRKKTCIQTNLFFILMHQGLSFY